MCLENAPSRWSVSLSSTHGGTRDVSSKLLYKMYMLFIWLITFTSRSPSIIHTYPATTTRSIRSRWERRNLAFGLSQHLTSSLESNNWRWLWLAFHTWSFFFLQQSKRPNKSVRTCWPRVSSYDALWRKERIVTYKKAVHSSSELPS